MNLVSASDVFKSAETWFPICLPKFNSRGFLHAHVRGGGVGWGGVAGRRASPRGCGGRCPAQVSYVDADCKACLLLLSTNAEAFYNLSQARNSIVKALSSNGCLESIAAAVRRRHYQICGWRCFVMPAVASPSS
jgi:hypothetical protein